MILKCKFCNDGKNIIGFIERICEKCQGKGYIEVSDIYSNVTSDHVIREIEKEKSCAKKESEIVVKKRGRPRK